MHLKNYRDDLLKRLRDPKYAAEYLAQVLAEQDNEAFLIDPRTRERLVGRDPACRDLIRPYLRGQDVARLTGAKGSGL